MLLERVSEAQRIAARELREMQLGGKGKRKRGRGEEGEGDEDEGEDVETASKQIINKFKGGGGGKKGGFKKRKGMK